MSSTPQIVGYGEDALTLWAMSSQMGVFLNALDDATLPNSVNVFFRPSFGRGRRTQRVRTLPAEFGEFDAVVLSEEAIYLVESKWSRSPELLENPIAVRPVQVRRHQVFRCYIEEWRRSRPIDWRAFEEGLGLRFSESDWGLRPAPAGSVLARNLEFMLRTCGAADLPIVDVLLLVVPAGWARQVHAPDPFRLVTMEYAPIADSDFVRMSNSQGQVPVAVDLLADALAYVQDHERVCPVAERWNELWESLPNRRQLGGGWTPPPPLILAAWAITSISDKRARLRAHIAHSAENGALNQTMRFLRSLGDDEWVYARDL